ncbi:MAG: type II/IV secretion system protein, partial [Thermoguttaceae bacterium]|nr:type II/IV secretion system protein [Thermoguttaceae bacterium]
MPVKPKASYTEILIRQGVLTPDQITEAEQMARQSNQKLQDVLIRQGYATGEEVARAMAEQHGLDYVDLTEVVIPPTVIELVPESVARENAIIPLSEEDGSLKIIASDPDDYDTIEKLRFILNRR